MDYKYEIGQQVIRKDYDKCLSEAKSIRDSGKQILLSKSGSIFLLNKDVIENIPTKLTVSHHSVSEDCMSYGFEETEWWLYEFMIEPPNKYLVRLDGDLLGF